MWLLFEKEMGFNNLDQVLKSENHGTNAAAKRAKTVFASLTASS